MDNPTLGGGGGAASLLLLQDSKLKLATASLSFLGFGVQPPQATWGNIITDGKTYLLDAWWLIVFPGLAIFVAALSFYLAGDALRQASETRSEKK